MKLDKIENARPGMFIIYNPDGEIEQGIISQVYDTIIQFDSKENHQFVSKEDINKGHIEVFTMEENPEFFL